MFAHDFWEPDGGWKDYIGCCETIEDGILLHYSSTFPVGIRAMLQDNVYRDSEYYIYDKLGRIGEIVDLDTLEVVWSAPYTA